MRRLQDPGNVELQAVLERLLSENIDVTAREVARRHPELKNASAFTRNKDRMAIIVNARQRQEQARSIAAGLPSSLCPADPVDSVLRTAEVQALELKLRRLVAAHAGLIRAVQLAGGMGALERFWKEHKDIGDAVKELGAAPQEAVVLEFSGTQRPAARDSTP